MKLPSSISAWRAGLHASLLPLAIGAAVLASTPALAQRSAAVVQFSGPSVAARAEAAVFTGSGFAANQALSISVKAPDGNESVSSTVAGADGTLRVQVSPSLQGVYEIRVLSTRGDALAKANLVAQP